VQLSSGGGTHPLWSPTRPELFYSAGDGRIMAVTYAVKDNTFIPEKPRLWAQGRFTVRQGV
jgi:hypothetical protein